MITYRTVNTPVSVFLMVGRISMWSKSNRWLQPFSFFYGFSARNILIKNILLWLHPFPSQCWMSGETTETISPTYLPTFNNTMQIFCLSLSLRLKLFLNMQYSDTCLGLQCFPWEGISSNVFSREWIGCARLLLSVSPEKCSLISSELAAMLAQGSIDNQSILQLVNCPGCWLGALGACSTSAGRDKSSLSVSFSLSLLLL